MFHTSLRSRQNGDNFVRPPRKQSPTTASYFPNDEGIQPALARWIGKFLSYTRNPEPGNALVDRLGFAIAALLLSAIGVYVLFAPYGGAA